jgi:hypothetical protein
MLNRGTDKAVSPAPGLEHGEPAKLRCVGITPRLVGRRRGLVAQRWKDYFSRRFQECLDRLALSYGFATVQRPSHLNPAGRHRVQAVRRSGE